MGLSGVSALEVQPFGGQAKFDFDADLVTFTAAMAKRDGAVFAAAPIVQGNPDGTGVPDYLAFLRGSQISSNFYANISTYQGGGFLIWTPEQSSADRTDAWDSVLFTAGLTYRLYYEWDNDRYALRIHNETIYVAATLTAGTPEYLAWGFDTNNTLDGTDHIYLSRNDAQTFGATQQPSSFVPDEYPTVGADSDSNPANGIIEGLTLVREIPWTGAYGTDMGQGDIVAAHAAGADVCRSIGSWGVTFCLPTSGAVGALVTGTTQAWTHPHTSALLTDTFCQTTYGSSAWGDEGTPSSGPADLAAGEKIFPWGYKWTCDAAAEGITQTIACAAGADFVLRVIAHCTSPNDIRVRIWDETNGAQIGADFDFGASSSRTQPGVALFCFEAPTIARNGVGSDCISISVKVMGTANTQEVLCHQIELQANVFDNPSLETGAGNPWIPDGWSNLDLDANDTEAEAGTVHSGVGSMEWNPAASEETILRNLTSFGTNKFATFGGWLYGDGSVGLQLHSLNGHLVFQHSTSDAYLPEQTAAAWTHSLAVFKCERLTPQMRVLAAAGASGDRFLDDLYLFALDAVSLTATPASKANSAEASGLRVDGRDTCTQPITGLKATSGKIRWKWTPRHDADQLGGFYEIAYQTVGEWFNNADNRIHLYASANRLTLLVRIAASSTTEIWDCTGAIVAGTTYDMEIRYTSTKIQLLVDGVVKATETRAVDWGANVPTEANWGHRRDDDRQIDATYAAP
jgi:hypothetical protein